MREDWSEEKKVVISDQEEKKSESESQKSEDQKWRKVKEKTDEVGFQRGQEETGEKISVPVSGAIES